MSLTPLMFRDWWDDFERERPSRIWDHDFKRDDFFNNLRTSLVRPGRYYRPWGDSLMSSSSGTSNVKINEKQCQLNVDVQPFAPNEITVKIADEWIVVEAKHDEKQDEYGYISRQFSRKYTVPKDADLENIVSSLSSDGVLTITVPKKIQGRAGERVVPIIQTGAPVLPPSTQPLYKSQDRKPNETHIKIEQEMK